MHAPLGSNAEGDFHMRPFVIGKYENPRAIKKVKDSLPVIYRHNTAAWMTKELFFEWFKHYFCPAVERYLIRKNLDKRALLVLDNCEGHGKIEDLNKLHPKIKVTFLPANVTSVLQPMDMGAISSFKKHYLKESFTQLRESLEKNETVEIFWKNYDIKKAIDNISKAWKRVTENNVKNVWNNLLVK